MNTIPNYKYPNSLDFMGDAGQHLFLFSSNELSRINAENGSVVWRTPNFYRLVGPFGLSLSDNGQTLGIITAELPATEQNQYIWRANIVSMDTGELQKSTDLKDQHTGRKSKVIEWISNDSFRVLTDVNKHQVIRTN